MFPGQYANHNQVARGITGGTLASDSTHYYRTFTSSGSFFISKGNVQISVIAIGGGSGNGGGNGGGAGNDGPPQAPGASA